jgi:Tol biopolymer transport system component/DNA-binding winged helix-turn-helix (wHTH) protein
MGDVEMPVAESVLSGGFQLGEFTVDPPTGEVRGPAGRAQLDPKVMDVLLVLAERAGHVVLREELHHAVWPGLIVSDDALSRCIYQLRRHLGNAGGSSRCKELLETLPKRGYRLNLAPGRPVLAPTRNIEPVTTAAPRVGKARFSVWLLPAVAAFLIMSAIGVWLNRVDYFWKDPLADAQFTPLTDFDGMEQEAAISRDGSLVAFLSDRDGTFDVWLSRIGTGNLVNLTHGRAQELRNPAVRTVDFSPDGSEVTFWTRWVDSSPGSPPIHRWAAPSIGGPPRPYLADVAEVAWSRDGTRMAYHTSESGDPMFVTEPNEKVGRQIFVAPPGLHCHFPLWSPDGSFIYFVYGRAPDEMDVWRIAPTGGVPEQITFHNSRVSYPVLLDDRTLLYLARAEDGSGPWLYGMNLQRRVAHRIRFGLQPFTSLAASADGRRLVATVTTPRTRLWRVPILDRPAEQSDASRIEVPALSGHSPRFGPDYLLYLAPTNGMDGLWKLTRGTVHELWNGRQGRVVAGAAIEPNGHRVVFPVALAERTTLHLIDPVEPAVQLLGSGLDVKGTPAWSPDGAWIAVAADRGGGPQLFTVPLDGGSPIPIVDEYSIDPAWSPNGRFLVYRGAELGPSFPLKAVTVGGEPYTMPNLVLPRGARFSFVSTDAIPSGVGLVVLKGEVERKNFWLIDPASGGERQLTDFGPGFVISDFDVSSGGREIVFDRVREESDLLLIEVGG